MKTIILNGSPKGEKGNSQIFASHFVKGTGNDYEIKCIVKEDYRVLAKTLEQYDAIIFVLPLYVHGIPSIVMKLFEQMKVLEKKDKSMGLIIQSGFTEPAQSRYAKKYFELVCKRLNYSYMGTIVKGASAGVYLMPDNMNKKLFAGLEELGRHYEQSGEFSKQVRNEFEKDYQLSKGKALFYHFLSKIKIGNMFWDGMLKKNNAYHQRFARPFEPTSE